MFKKLALVWLLMGCLVTAQDPSIRIVEQDCTSGSEFVLIQARIYNSGGKQVRVDYRYSSLPDKQYVPLTLFSDVEDETLFWAFLPETPEMQGISSGLLEYSISVESPFGETFNESGVMEVTPRCSFNPEYNSGQAAELANLKNLLGKEEQIRLQKLQLQRARRSRNIWVGSSLLAGVGAALVLGSSSDDNPQASVTLSIQPLPSEDMELSTDGSQGSGYTEEFALTLERDITTQFGEFEFCIYVNPNIDASLRREARELFMQTTITVDNADYEADLISVSSPNLPSALTLNGDENNGIRVGLNLSSVLRLIQDRARAVGNEVTFTDSFICDADTIPVRVQFTLEIRKKG